MDATTTPKPAASTGSALIDSTELARQLNVEPDTVKAWRQNGKGPAFVRISRQLVRYRQSDVDAFVAASTHQPEASA